MSSELRRLWEQAGGQIPDAWKIVPLESLLRDSKSIAVGVMYPGPDTPGGTPLIKVGDIKDGIVPIKPSYCISDKTNDEHKRTQLVGDELLITLVGNPGECVVVNTSMMVKRILRKYKYPPDRTEAAVQLVLDQAETLSAEWG